MARTHSRKISRRKAKKKNPFPAVILLVYILGLSLTYVYFYIDSANKESMLQDKKDMLADTERTLRNLETDIEKCTSKTFIMKRLKENGSDLRYPINGQVVEMRHFDGTEGPAPERLREGEEVFAAITER